VGVDPAPGVVAALQRIGSRRRFARRETLFHEGDPADSFHLVMKGRVAVQVHTALGSAVTLDVIGPGDTLGELSVLTPGPRAASAIAVEACETMRVPAAGFDELRAAQPEVFDHLVSQVVAHNRALIARLAEVAAVGAESRVLRRLLEVATLYSSADASIVPLTQEELAGLAATTRETVNRVLRREEAAGSVALRRGRVEVLDAEALRSRC
jgi:CRP-like cAMP-binding protein